MKNKRFSSLSMLLCACLLSSFVVPRVAIAQNFVGRLVSDIINDVRLSGVGLIDQANHTGNALISRAGNEATVLAGNLNFILKDNLNDSFDSLSEERKLLLVEADNIRRDLAETTDRAYEIKDSLALDLNSLVTSLPFIKKEFFIQSIKGLSYLPGEASYRLRVSATTLGIHENISTDIKVYDGHGVQSSTLNDVTVDQSQQRFFADILLPHKFLSLKVNDNNLVTVPMTLGFDVTKTKGWWIFKTESTESHKVPIYVSLYPKKAADVVVVTKEAVHDWVSLESKSESLVTPNRHCRRRCDGSTRGGNKIEFKVFGGGAPYDVGDKKLVNPKYKCMGPSCPWSDTFDLYLTDNDTKLVFTWVTFSKPSTWKVWADVQEYQLIEEREQTADTARVDFFSQFTALVPEKFTHGILRVKTFTKNEYELQIGEADPNGLLRYQGTTSAGPNKKRISYRVDNPA